MNDAFLKAISEAIRSKVDEIASQEIALAKKRIEERTRGMLPEVCSSISKWYQMEHRGDQLTITVRIPSNDRPTSSP